MVARRGGRAKEEELVLTLPDGKAVVVSSRNPSVTLGRDRTCDVP